MFFCAFFAFTKAVSNAIWNSSARAFAKQECGGNEKDPEYDTNLKKFREEGWKAAVTAMITSFGFYVISSEEVRAINIAQWTQRYPQLRTPLMIWYYRIALGYHVFRTIGQFFEKRRKDFIAMMIHHWITITLIISSQLLSVTEVGIIVMVIHDNGDMLLAMSKFFTWLGFKNLRTVIYAIFVLAWIAFRVVGFSMYVLIPVMTAGNLSCHPWFYIFTVLLSGLLVLHLYWLKAILTIAFGLLYLKADVNDMRSDEEKFRKIVSQKQTKKEQ
jgi:ceramide synthetase